MRALGQPMTNKLLVGIVAVVIIVAAAAAAIILLNDKEKEPPAGQEYSDLQLMIYGNANNDFTIDNSDLELVNSIVSGENTDGLQKYPFADANCDGKVDADDITLLQSIVNREPCTVNVACMDSEGKNVSVPVQYPLDNIALYGLNIINSALFANVGSQVVAYASPSGVYANAHASMQGVNFFSSGAFDWQAFMQVDTQTPIGALFCDYSYVSSFMDGEIFDTLRDAEIPVVIYSPSSPDEQTSATATIGFLCGEETEAIGSTYARLCLDVMDEINAKTAGIAPEDRATFIGATMYIVLLNNSNASQEIGRLAGGIPYYEVNSEYKTLYDAPSVNPMNINRESLANFQDADVYMSVRTSDFGGDPEQTVRDNFEYVYYNICNSLEFYEGVLDRMCFINNLLPGVIKAAYLAEMMYPDLFDGYGDKVAQQFIEAGFAPFEGQTVDSLMGCLTYQDYLDAKAASS